MFKTILVPVDLSHEKSWRTTLPLAVEMATASEGVLHVTAVVPDFGAAMVQDFFPKDFERTSLDHAKTALAEVVASAVPDTVRSELHLEHGSIRTHVLERAKAVSADLILMASQPPDQLREFLVGSHADWIVRHSPISVLVVRDHGAAP